MPIEAQTPNPASAVTGSSVVPSGRPDYSRATLRLLYGMRQRQLAVGEVLQRVGLPADFCDKPVSVRGRQFLGLLRTVKQVCEDEFFCLTRRRCKPGTLDMMTRTGLHCQTLQAFIEHCCEFFCLMTDDVVLHLRTEQDWAVLSVDVSEPALDPDLFLAEFWLLHFHRLCSWVTSFMLPLQAVQFVGAVHMEDGNPQPQERLQYYLLKSWQGGTGQNSFSFHARYLRLPIVKTLPELRQHLAADADEEPIWPDNLLTWSARVRGCLKRSLGLVTPLLDLEAIAQELQTTARSLRRHLADEGTSFQVLRDDLRRDLAIEKLYVQHLPVADVAEQLGFAEPRSFSRAFKQWTGASPRRYQGGS